MQQGVCRRRAWIGRLTVITPMGRKPAQTGQESENRPVNRNRMSAGGSSGLQIGDSNAI
jgi:hypothetical protein